MRAENFFTANPDLCFTFNHVIPWDRLVPAVEAGFTDPGGPTSTKDAVDTYREALTLIGAFAGSEIAQRAREVDEAGACHHDGPLAIPEPLQQNLAGLKELGVTGLSVPRGYGGEGFPFTVSCMALELIARACPSTMVQYAFYVSPAMMLLRFGDDELKERYVPRLAAGEISGAVAMTEPQAGSDVGRIATTARQVDGEWRISGRKQFITNGIGDFCIVLARSEPRSEGLEGLSLFLVDRRGQDGNRTVYNYVVERGESKICLTASATCGLAFDDSRGILLGESGDGWPQILTFMNESRVAVGIQGLGTAQAAKEAATRYAAARVQGGKPIREHPVIADMLLDMEATVAALRALAYEATVHYDLVQALLHRLERMNVDDPTRAALEQQMRREMRHLRELTPLVKWLGAEEVIGVCRAAMQIHGGYGVIKEYEVERILRDSLILPIYEGTSQIQALMATRDLLKSALNRPTSLVGGTLSPALAAARFPGQLGTLYRRAIGDFNSAVRFLLRDLLRRAGVPGTVSLFRGRSRLEEEHVQYALLQAERLTGMLAHLHAARLLASQVGMHAERRPVALRAMRRATDVTAAGSRAIKSGDRSTLEAIDRWRKEGS